MDTAQMMASELKPTLLENYQSPVFKIPKVDLELHVHADGVVVRCKLEVKKVKKDDAKADLVLDGHELELIKVKKNGVELTADKYTKSDTHLTIQNPGDEFNIETEVLIHPERNSQLSGLYESKHGFFTQCEAEGFRRITYYQDRPDILSRFDTKIFAPKRRFPVLLSNGNLINSGKVDEETHFAHWTDPHPKPSYLFALVLGRLEKIEETYVTKSKKETLLQIYAPEEQIKFTTFAMQALKRAMRWDEDRFGLEVDLDQYMIVAVDDFNMGAMENKGLNIFNTKYILARGDISTDRDFMLLDRVVAHEYFHNWTGNRITCRDWFQLSLKEGLTVFRDQEYGADIYSRGVQRIQEVRGLRTIQFPEDSGPMAHPIRPDSYIEINNFYTATVYEKGAEIVRMIHTLLGETSFQKGMRLYIDRHDGQAVTTEEFVSSMEDASGVDLTIFRNWYTQAGTPHVHVDDTYDPDSNTYTLKCKQSFNGDKFRENKPVHIPIKLQLFTKEGGATPEQVVSMTGENESFTFREIKEKPIPSLFRGFSAPVIAHYDYSIDDLIFLLIHDTDLFNRWEAGQLIQTRLIKDAITEKHDEPKSSFRESFLNALSGLIAESRTDQAFLAEILSTPTESEISESFSVIDPDAINQSRENLRATIAQFLEGQLIEQYQELIDEKPYHPDAKSAGQRALKNTFLDLLCKLQNPEYFKMSIKQYETATNMTTRVGALQSLIHYDIPERDELVDKFYSQWHTEDLVVDKWFALQASSRAPSTTNRVRELMLHQSFNLKNPNKVFSLLRTFIGNPIHFHAKNGAGYDLIANAILRIDPINAQVAARLARGFDQWKKFEAERQVLAKLAIEKILNYHKISSDTAEILNRTINDKG